MYEKNGEKYFVVDSHCHFWDASRENWKPGAEQFAKGWIDCFYGYHQLGPPQTHWDFEKYLKVTPEDFERDMFIEGHVDYAIFQSTYVKEWYTKGFNTVEQNAQLLERFGDRLIVNGRFDPRDGDAGLKELEADAEKYGLKGVKLYTAEWNCGSRGYKLSDPEAYVFLARAQELGIKNIHVHKGPTIWPLDKDAFDVADVDHAATDFPDLNFIVEHVGLPRIEDFCFMAVQEPNVYAGLSVAIPFIHSKPRYFAQIIGELCYWLGEDRILFASDYAIWQPKWLVEKFVDFEIPEDLLGEYAPLTPDVKRKILGLNAAALYDIEIPADVAT